MKVGVYGALYFWIKKDFAEPDNKLNQNAIIQIASSVWKAGSKDIRDVLKIAKLCNTSDTEEDMSRLISIHHKYRKTDREYN